MKKSLHIIIPVISALLLCACGKTTPPSETLPPETPTQTVMPGPYAEKERVLTVDYSSLSDDGVEEAVEWLRSHEGLELISLGKERDSLSWDSVYRIVSVRGGADIDFTFNIYGKECHLADTRLDLNGIPADDDGSRVMTVTRCMYSLRSLDMDSCGVPDENMEIIRDALPDCDVVWRIWFGDTLQYSVRTDTERILASMPSFGCILAPGTYDNLKYCTKVKYMDLGFNSLLEDVKFAQFMPELEVLIITRNRVSDISPLAQCRKLEYLEMANNMIGDLSPLKDIQSLRHVNFCNNPLISDISPLLGLKELKRVWIGGNNNYSQEQLERLCKALPEADVNVSCDEYYEHWFYDDDRYWQLREQFGDYEFEAYSFYLGAQ